MPADLKEYIQIFENSKAFELGGSQTFLKRSVEEFLAPVFEHNEDLLFMANLENDFLELDQEHLRSFEKLLCLAISTCDTNGSKKFLNSVSFILPKGSKFYDLYKITQRIFSGIQLNNLEDRLKALMDKMIVFETEHGDDDPEMKSLLINLLLALIDLINRTTDSSDLMARRQLIIELVMSKITTEPLTHGQGIIMRSFGGQVDVNLVYPKLLTS
jgi:hypothetical protein